MGYEYDAEVEWTEIYVRMLLVGKLDNRKQWTKCPFSVSKLFPPGEESAESHKLSYRGVPGRGGKVHNRCCFLKMFFNWF